MAGSFSFKLTLQPVPAPVVLSTLMKTFFSWEPSLTVVIVAVMFVVFVVVIDTDVVGVVIVVPLFVGAFVVLVIGGQCLQLFHSNSVHFVLPDVNAKTPF